MVTAGVYLVARSSPIFDASMDARTLVEIVGAVTLMMGAIIGCGFDDIKKVLAASTMSQIGYMMLAVGLGPGAYAIGILHLLAHGFFKANMFLGAGAVMHGNNDEVNMRRYGGLRKVMPWTFITFACGYLAIIGMVPFSAFWTKDKIIEAALDQSTIGGYTLGAVALAGAGLTAYYMTRLMVMTFFGQKRWPRDVHPHDPGPVMMVPMVILAIGSAVAGGLMVVGGSLQNFLTPAVGTPEESGFHTVSPWILTVLALAVMAGGAVASWWWFGRKPVPAEPPTHVTPVTKAARASLYGDALNESLFMRPGAYFTRALVFFDNRGVDGLVNGLAAGIGGTSARLRRAQTGFVRSYALSMLAGALAIAAALVLVRVG
jgi:NADH-quinone oxidoreductase subunit L